MPLQELITLLGGLSHVFWEQSFTSQVSWLQSHLTKNRPIQLLVVLTLLPVPIVTIQLVLLAV